MLKSNEMSARKKRSYQSENIKKKKQSNIQINKTYKRLNDFKLNNP